MECKELLKDHPAVRVGSTIQQFFRDFRWMMEATLARQEASEARKQKAENTGVLISSGLIAGGALTAVIIAFIVLGYNLLGTPLEGTDNVPTFLDRARDAMGVEPISWLGLIAFLGVGYMLARTTVNVSKDVDA